MLTFNCIDVETANADRASICQIGIVHVHDGEIRDQWKTLIDPEDWFDPWNIGIHGIDEASVNGSPTLPAVREELRRRLRGSVLVSHTAFDRVAFERAMTKYSLEQLQVTWLDSARVTRCAWPDNYGVHGWGLKNIAKELGISFRHHDALEDARAVAEIVLRACDAAELDIEGWLQRVERPIFPFSESVSSVRREGNMEGPLYGETIVFTGALGIPRREAADLAASSGCNVVPNVTKKVTMLVVGTHDKSKLNGYDKSSKHRTAEALIDKGMDIQILSETDFSEIIGIDMPKQKEKSKRTLESIIQDTLVKISETCGLAINSESMSSVMRMKTKMIVSVWKPLVGFDKNFLDGLDKVSRQFLHESGLSLCQGQQDGRFQSVLSIHVRYQDVEDGERLEKVEYFDEFKEDF